MITFCKTNRDNIKKVCEGVVGGGQRGQLCRMVALLGMELISNKF